MSAEVGALSLIPAAVTIAVALVWRQVAIAIGCGVVTGALLVGGMDLPGMFKALGLALWSGLSDPERLKVIFFILIVGGLLEVISVSGAYHAFADTMGRHIHNARRTRMAAWGLSASLFFDDYANVLITGNSMRKLSARTGVRPAMVAYIIDVVAILASVILVSTWAAFEGSEMARAAAGIGLQKGMSELFLESLPYHFYTYLAVFLTLLVAITGRWFGAGLDKHHFALAEPIEEVAGENLAGAKHVAAPLLTLVIGACTGVAGIGLWKCLQAGEALTPIGILRQAPTLDIMVCAALAALGVGVFQLCFDGVMHKSAVRPAFTRGVKDMVGIGIIILLATALTHLSTELGAGSYLASALTRALSPAWLPAGIFLLSMLVTVSTGFSWGAMAIVMPVAYSLATNNHGLIPILSAAVITGAVSGEHLIPYSEKAVLSAAACGIPTIYHFKTHVFQSITAFLAAGAGFALAGHGWSLPMAYGLPLIALTAVHFLLAR